MQCILSSCEARQYFKCIQLCTDNGEGIIEEMEVFLPAAKQRSAPHVYFCKCHLNKSDRMGEACYERQTAQATC